MVVQVGLYPKGMRRIDNAKEEVDEDKEKDGDESDDISTSVNGCPNRLGDMVLYTGRFKVDSFYF